MKGQTGAIQKQRKSDSIASSCCSIRPSMRVLLLALRFTTHQKAAKGIPSSPLPCLAGLSGWLTSCQAHLPQCASEQALTSDCRILQWHRLKPHRCHSSGVKDNI